jgi:hypothetical protein
MSMKRTLTGILAATFVVGTVSAIPANAALRSRATHAMSCATATGPNATLNSVRQLYNASSTLDTELVCPLQTEGNSNFNYQKSGGKVYVHGYSNGFNWTAKACVTYWDSRGTGGDCGGLLPNQPSGLVQKELDRTAWINGHVDDFPFIYVKLGKMVSGSANLIWGIKLEEPI